MIPEPDTRMREILSYLSYLSHTGLYISLHPCRPSSLLSRPEFLPYNLHRHPYCRYLKTNESLWRHCIARQEKVLRHAEQGAFFGVCHAGMGEFVYPMTEEGQVIGFVSVSGYRGKEEITAPRRKALTWKYGFPASEAEATFQETVRQAPPHAIHWMLLLPRCFVCSKLQPPAFLLPILHTGTEKTACTVPSLPIFIRTVHILSGSGICAPNSTSARRFSGTSSKTGADPVFRSICASCV